MMAASQLAGWIDALYAEVKRRDKSGEIEDRSTYG